ncbi:hypothetical protein O3P69_008539 [Scylla paramamosain]|uniref:Uncharacterized protein n=1 Tax=Scylla paramamosain TaxID=85552 RepID=A0AAW0SM46_SCYPA
MGCGISTDGYPNQGGPPVYPRSPQIVSFEKIGAMNNNNEFVTMTNVDESVDVLNIGRRDDSEGVETVDGVCVWLRAGVYEAARSLTVVRPKTTIPSVVLPAVCSPAGGSV